MQSFGIAAETGGEFGIAAEAGGDNCGAAGAGVYIFGVLSSLERRAVATGVQGVYISCSDAVEHRAGAGSDQAGHGLH